MDGISVSVDGIEKVLLELGNMSVRTYDKMYKLYDEASAMCLTNAKADCPVLSGELRDSGEREINETQLSAGGVEIEALVRFGTDHCWYVELGTYKAQAQPFLYPNFVDAKDWLDDQLQNILR